MPIFNSPKKPEGAAPNVPFAAAVDAAKNNKSPTKANDLDLEKNDPFWFRPEIEPLNWNKNFPYQLSVVKLDQNGQPILDQDWNYVLPVPPENLTVGAPFASTIYATQGGVVEEHNGMPFRNISITGSTGVLPIRGNAGVVPAQSVFQSVFAGTLQNVSRFTNVTNAAGITKVDNLVKDDDINGEIGKGSGYYQFHLMAQFLERYASFKKTANGRDYRLALMMWKDQHFYLVKPEGQFTLSRTAASPLEYRYSLNLKAWKRIKFNGNNPNEYSFIPAVRDAGILGKVLQTLSLARNAIGVAADTIRATGEDIDNSVFEPLRQTILFCKDLLGIPKAMSDVPRQLIKDAAGSVVLYVSTRQDYEDFNKPGPDGVGAYQKEWENMRQVAQEVASLGVQTLSGSYNSSDIISKLNKVLSGNKTIDPTMLNSVLASQIQGFFEDPNKYLPFFDAINPSLLQMPREWNRKLDQDSGNIKTNSNRSYWEEQTNKIQTTLNNFEYNVGAGSDIVSETYHNGSNSNKTPTEEDFDIIYNLNLVIQNMGQLATSEDVNFFNANPTAFIAGLANRAGIAFNEPRSKFLVPFPYGFTLENLALRYLNDPNRWIEISALNGLRPPYIDEEGFDLLLLTNGLQNEVAVANIENLYVGQSVSLISNVQNKTQRIIQKIKRIDDSYFILTLDGDADLDVYLNSDNAALHAFLPNTINSQMSIYIPSNEDPQYEDFIYKPIPNVDNLNPLFKIANIDLLLDSKNDIVLNQNGDTPLAVGLNAIIQDLRIKVSTVRGSILQHPSFGLPIDVGYSLADVNASDILKALRDTFKGDTTYTNFSMAQVNISGPVSSIFFTVGLRGLAEVIPVTIDLK